MDFRRQRETEVGEGEKNNIQTSANIYIFRYTHILITIHTFICVEIISHIELWVLQSTLGMRLTFTPFIMLM